MGLDVPRTCIHTITQRTYVSRTCADIIELCNGHADMYGHTDIPKTHDHEHMITDTPSLQKSITDTMDT